MQIEDGCLVSLDVRLYDAQGGLLEASDAPVVYLHGAQDILPALEVALTGRAVGDELSLTLEPEDAFGDDDAQRVHLFTVDEVGGDVEIGMQFEGLPGQPSDGRIYTVTDRTREVVVLDGNHPLAGRTLRFDLRVAGVERATAAQIAEAQAMSVPGFLAVGTGPVDADRDADDTEDAPPGGRLH